MERQDRTLEALIEIPMGSRNKYEYDDAAGRMRLDRVLYTSMHYPTDYGFVPDTLAEDGDHLDILVLTYESTFPGCLVPARPIGGLDMEDEKGLDFKVLAVPTGDPRWHDTYALEDLAPHWLKEIEAFFATYKMLEPKYTEVLGWHDVDDAWRQIEEARARWQAEGSNP